MVFPSSSPTLFDWTALAAADFSVFPLRRHSKTPLDTWKRWQTERANGDQIDAWLAEHPNANIGIATGAISGVVVLDLDSAEASVIAEGRGLPRTVEALTPRGRHLFFAHPGANVSNVTGSEGGKLPKGLDVRGDGGFVVAAGSYYVPTEAELADGKLEGAYRWREGHGPSEARFAPMPDWLAAALAPATNTVDQPSPASLATLKPTSDRPQDRWAQSALEREVEAVRSAQKGNRNHQLNRSAFAIAQIVAGGGLDGTTARQELESAANACGLGTAETKATISSAWHSGAREPRSRPTSTKAGLVSPVAPEANASPLGEMVRASDVSGMAVPERRWLWDQWLPVGACTGLFGDGGLGKSLLAKQIATAIATGSPLFGLATKQAKVLAFYCEDDAPELARRQQSVCSGMNIPVSAVDGYFYQSRFGVESLLGSIDKRTGAFVANQLYAAIRQKAQDVGARLIILDNILHLFGADINDPGAVTRFMALMNRLALEIDGAVLLLGHIAKAENSKFSGTTAWSNASRNRLFLGRPTDANEAARDPDARILERSKANYARSGDTLTIMWHYGAFARPEDIGPAGSAQSLQDALDNRDFLDRLATLTRQRRPLSIKKQAKNYAPRVMSQQPGIRHQQTEQKMERAMGRLLTAGVIAPDMPLGFADDHRHPVTGLAKIAAQSAALCGSVPDESAAQLCGSDAVICGSVPASTEEKLRLSCGSVPKSTPVEVAAQSAAQLCGSDAVICGSVPDFDLFSEGKQCGSDAAQSAALFPQTPRGSVGAPEGGTTIPRNPNGTRVTADDVIARLRALKPTPLEAHVIDRMQHQRRT
jgi:RecA-family ATPase